MKIKTGDNVVILAGKDKGKTGKVIQTFPDIDKVVVEGLNISIKHLKGRDGQPGKKVEYPSPIHISNVTVAVKSGVGRIGYDVVEKDGKVTKNRVLRKAGKSETI